MKKDRTTRKEEIKKLNMINKIKGIIWDLWSEKDNPKLAVHQTIDLKAKIIYKLVNSHKQP